MVSYSIKKPARRILPTMRRAGARIRAQTADRNAEIRLSVSTLRPDSGQALPHYPSIFFRSSSGVDIGVRPNCVTSVFSTFGDRNAGSEGPM